MANQEQEFSMNDMLFVALVRDFEQMAMVGFGKLVDPVSQTAQRNLERAKVAIDMIGMLEEKTKGNVNDTEAALLQQVLTNLRLNYVDELEKEKVEKQSESGVTGEAEPPESTGAEDAPAAGAEAQNKTAKTSPASEGAKKSPAKKKSKKKASTGGRKAGEKD
jgi:hypothetical protein